MDFSYLLCYVPFFDIHTIRFQKIERLQLRKTASSIVCSRCNLNVNAVRGIKLQLKRILIFSKTSSDLYAHYSIYR